LFRSVGFSIGSAIGVIRKAPQSRSLHKKPERHSKKSRRLTLETREHKARADVRLFWILSFWLSSSVLVSLRQFGLRISRTQAAWSAEMSERRHKRGRANRLIGADQVFQSGPSRRNRYPPHSGIPITGQEKLIARAEPTARASFSDLLSSSSRPACATTG